MHTLTIGQRARLSACGPLVIHRLSLPPHTIELYTHWLLAKRDFHHLHGSNLQLCGFVFHTAGLTFGTYIWNPPYRNTPLEHTFGTHLWNTPLDSYLLVYWVFMIGEWTRNRRPFLFLHAKHCYICSLVLVCRVPYTQVGRSRVLYIVTHPHINWKAYILLLGMSVPVWQERHCIISNPNASAGRHPVSRSECRECPVGVNACSGLMRYYV